MARRRYDGMSTTTKSKRSKSIGKSKIFDEDVDVLEEFQDVDDLQAYGLSFEDGDEDNYLDPSTLGQDEGNNALHRAAQYGHLEVVIALIEAGASLHAHNASGRSPLHFAADCGHAEIVDVLLQAGADTEDADPVQVRPLHVAAQGGHVTAMRLLLAAGADIHALAQGNVTALQSALEMQQVGAVRLLLQAGAPMMSPEQM
ncbi:hypothetical protein CYMTET_33140, partial [Cymbomonas tetramitiformis]